MLDVHGLLGRLEGARPGAGGFMAKCPAHEDGKASLKIADGDKGIVLYCHAGCSSADILKALGIEWGDLFSEEATKARGEWTPGGEAIAVYDYVDAGGELRYQVLRTADKQFYQRHRDPSTKSGYAWNMRGVGRLPYRLPAVIEAVRAGMTTFIVEGEKDVQACEQQGLVATCNSGGAGKWLPEFAEHFAGGTVVIVADPDDVGRKHARSIMASLAGEVSSVRIVEAAEGSRDAAEHFANGHGVSDFVQTAGPEEPQPDLMEDVLTFIAGEDHWDWIVPGLLEHRDRLILTGYEGKGKMLRLDEPIPTPTGWSTMGALQVGNQVLDRMGRPCNVTGLSAIDPSPETYAIRFSDGSSIEACAEHQWSTVSLADRQPARRGDGPPTSWPTEVVTTKEILRTLKVRGAANHAIPTTEPLDLPEVDLPTDPYMLGVWLGDGHTADGRLTINRDDQDILTRFPAEWTPHLNPGSEQPGSVGAAIPGLRVHLRTQGLLGNKHIPYGYQRASIEQRKRLLAGLMDTDGTVGLDGAGSGRGRGAATCELTLCDEVLAHDAHELLLGLGIKATIKQSDAVLEGRIVGQRWRMAFQSPFNPFLTERKAKRWTPLRTYRSQLRYIIDVVPCDPSPMRCIAVDSPSHTYLAGRDLIPTHNTTLIRQMAVTLASGIHPFMFRPITPVRVMVVDCENGESFSRRKYRNMIFDSAQRGQMPDEGMFRIKVRTNGLDLLDEEDAAWLNERLMAYGPDVLFIGPLYKLHHEDPSKAQPTLAVQAVLDRLRDEHGCALIMEAHAGHGGGGFERALRPEGHSSWLRWPEFGYGLLPDRDGPPNRARFSQWRGPRDERDWPEYVDHGSAWPWEGGRSNAWPSHALLSDSVPAEPSL